MNVSKTPVAISASDLTTEYMTRLRSFLQPNDTLEATGYILQELSSTEIDKKKRCQRCGITISKGRNRGGHNKYGEARRSRQVEEENQELSAIGLESKIRKMQITVPSQALAEGGDGVWTPEKQQCGFRCKFHDGVMSNKMWSCCGKHVSSAPCKRSESHISRSYQAGQLESYWKFHRTPSTGKLSGFRHAVAIDCEMGTAKSGDSELIRVTLIDYFSSEVLVDSLVYPDVAMSHYNTCFSGVTPAQMRLAHRQGRCLYGKQQARKAVWRFVGPNTVVIGHSAHNDLNAMRWIHGVIVDTWVIESMNAKHADTKAKQQKDLENASQASHQKVNETKEKENLVTSPKKKKAKGSGALSLKTLTMLRWGQEIQTRGNKGHDSLEDAIATRDLAHWNVTNQDLGAISAEGN